MASFAPLLMACLKVFAQKDPKGFLEIARLCYIYAWRAYRVCNRRSDAGIDSIASIAQKLYEGSATNREVTDTLRQLINRYGNDKDFEKNLRDNTLNGPERRWLLWRWEVSVAKSSKQEPYIMDWKTARQLEIEHIWAKNVIDFSDKQNEVYKKIHEEIVDKIGNLVLLQKPLNASIRNQLPKHKREYLIDTNQASARRLQQDSNFNELCQNGDLGPRRTRRLFDAAKKFIEGRTEEIVKFALEEWKL